MSSQRKGPVPWRCRWAHALVALGTVLLGCLCLTPPASAHSQLVWTQPTDTSEVHTPPTQVLLKFATDVDVAHSSIRVVGPDGLEHQVGVPTSSLQGVVSVRVDDRGPAGTWQVHYDIQSWDRHRVRGELTFGVSTSGADVEQARGHQTAYLVGGLALLVLVLVAWLGVLTRRRQIRRA